MTLKDNEAFSFVEKAFPFKFTNGMTFFLSFLIEQIKNLKRERIFIFNSSPSNNRCFEMVKVGFMKLGSLGSAALIEFLLDERAERQDIQTVTIGTGSKITKDWVDANVPLMIEAKPDFCILTSPNAALKGPKGAVKKLIDSGIPVVVVSDKPAEKAIEEFEDMGAGYVFVSADSMIGARREFLDPVEMSLYNTDLIKVLAITGVLNLIYEEIDRMIDEVKQGKKPEPPKIKVRVNKALKKAGFINPYAESKAYAAYIMAEKVADLTVKGCFIEKDWKKYTLIVSAAHELMRFAGKLADEAREIEKYGDSVQRRPHYDDGTILMKRKLIEKPRAEKT